VGDRVPEEVLAMPSTAVVTVVKMLESLPEPVQDRIADHLREYIADLRDELRWDDLFQRTQPQLAAAARRAREEIAAGKAKPLNLDDL
jgi:hypothetical protein